MRKFFIKLSLFFFFVFLAGSVGNAQTVYNLIMVLSGENQNPSVTTSGYAVGWGTLDLNLRKLTYAVAYDSLSGAPSGSHFHLGAEGENGSVVHPITFDANGVSTGEWTDIPDTTIAHILKGRVYCNIHTAAHGSGEIRGQLEYAGPFTFPFLALGSNVSPPTGETGEVVGFATFGLGVIAVNGVFKGLTGPPNAMHIHYGAVGQNGSVAIQLTSVGSMVIGGGIMPNDSSYRKLLAGEMYFNIHTTAHSGGELRGQLMGPRIYPFWASMDGTQSVPSNASTGMGFFLLRYDAVEKAIGYGSQIVGLTDVTGAHIHAGAYGQNGGVMIPLSFGTTGFANNGDQGVAIMDSVIRRLCKMEAYVNVHTSAFSGGEIRGQIMPAYNATAVAFLDGEQQVPTNSSLGTGIGAVMFPPVANLNEMYFALLADGLTGPATAAHIHAGSPGQSGGVVIPLDFTTNGYVAEVEDSIMIQLLRGDKHYMNVHTSANSGGEIRGDIHPFDGGDENITSAQELNNGSTPHTFSLSQNYPNPFNPSTTIQFGLPVTSNVRIMLFNILGQMVGEVVRGEFEAGNHKVAFNASHMSSGVYFYRLEAGSFVDVKKLMLVK